MLYTGSAAEYMTPSPYSVAAYEPISAAADLMQRYGIRHLPVLENGKLVGVLSERDLKVVQALSPAEVSQLSVSDVMVPEPYSASPTAPLTRVAREMARRKCGSVVVMERDAVVGILTTTDALLALVDALEGKTNRPAFEQQESAPPRGRTRPITPPARSRRSGT